MELNNPKYTWEQLEVMMANLIISQQHNEKILNEKFIETDKKFIETDKKFEKTDLEIQKLQQIINKSSIETDKSIKAMSKEISRLYSLYTSQWGKLIESLIAPSCLSLFKERGIDVSQTYRNIISKKERIAEAEFDVVLANGTEIVIVEVKTTMKIEDVNYLIEKMKNIRYHFPKWSDCKFYGAVAAVSYDEFSHRYAYKKGLYVITNKAEGILKIANKSEFKPIAF